MTPAVKAVAAVGLAGVLALAFKIALVMEDGTRAGGVGASPTFAPIDRPEPPPDLTAALRADPPWSTATAAPGPIARSTPRPGTG